jgi:hypothetical protein
MNGVRGVYKRIESRRVLKSLPHSLFRLPEITIEEQALWTI